MPDGGSIYSAGMVENSKIASAAASIRVIYGGEYFSARPQKRARSAAGLACRGVVWMRDRGCAPPAARKAPAPSRPRGRQSAVTKPARGRRSAQTLGDQVLALANGRTQQEIAAACKGARPNHVGVVIAGHKRAGRIEERDGRLYATRAMEGAQNAAI